MLTILMWLGVFAIALAFLLWSSDKFIDASEKIGLALGMPRIIIGSLLLAFGTSLPELFTSLVAIFAEDPEASKVVVGNVVGSNIANILLVFGTMAVIGKNVKINSKGFIVELILLLLATFLLSFFMWNNDISLLETIVLAIAYVAFIIYTIRVSGEDDDEEEAEKDAGAKQWLILVAGGAGIYLGAKFTVDSIVQLSTLLNFGVDVISLSAVALGTSLPELVVSVVATRKGQTDMAIGNVVGSNIFNILGVITIPSLASILTFGRGLSITSDIFHLSVPLMVFAAIALTVILLSKRARLWQGAILILLYLLYNLELYTGLILD